MNYKYFDYPLELLTYLEKNRLKMKSQYSTILNKYKHKKLLTHQWMKQAEEHKKELLKWADKLITAHDDSDYLSYADDGLALTTNINEWADNAASCLYQLTELLK